MNFKKPKALFNITDRLLNKAKLRILPEHNDVKQLVDDFVEYFDTKIKNITNRFQKLSSMMIYLVGILCTIYSHSLLFLKKTCGN